MESIAESIIVFIIEYLDFLAYDNIISGFFKSSKREYEKNIYYLISYIIVNILLGKYLGGMNIEKIIIVFSTRFLLFYIIYKRISIIPILLIWEVIASTLESIVYIGVVALFNIPAEQIENDIRMFGVASILSYISIYILSIIIKKWIERNLNVKYISKKEWFISILYQITNYTVIYAILYKSRFGDDLSNVDILICIALFSMSMMMLYIISEFCKSNKIKREMAVLEREQKVQQNSLQSMEQAYKKQRQLTHDYNNRLEMLRIIRQKNDYSELEEALNSMTGNNNRIRTVVTTQNTIIDAVLNQKYAKAMELGIGMEFNLQYLKDLPIDSQDIGIILANAIDNAISAADKAKQKFVQIFMSYEDEMFLCAIRNTVDKKVKIVNKSVVKEDDDLTHGYGIANIKRILEKYNSNFLIECDDKYFILTFMISLL